MYAHVSSLYNTAAPRSQDWICIGKKITNYCLCITYRKAWQDKPQEQTQINRMCHLPWLHLCEISGYIGTELICGGAYTCTESIQLGPGKTQPLTAAAASGERLSLMLRAGHAAQPRGWDHPRAAAFGWGCWGWNCTRRSQECCAHHQKPTPRRQLTLLKGVCSMWPFLCLQHEFLEYLWHLLQKQRHWPVTSPSGAILSTGSFSRLT